MKVGARVKSQVCEGEFVVVKAGPDADQLSCGGVVVVAERADTVRQIEAGHDGGALIGKRYVDDSGTVEVLCTKNATGALALAGTLLTLREAKKLPSSD